MIQKETIISQWPHVTCSNVPRMWWQWLPPPSSIVPPPNYCPILVIITRIIVLITDNNSLSIVFNIPPTDDYCLIGSLLEEERIKLLTFFQNQFFPSERGVHCQFTIVQSNIYNMTGISILLHPDMNNDIIQHWTTKATQPNTKPHLWAKILSAEFGRVLKKLGTVNRFKIDDGWNKQNWNKWSNGARIIQI